MNEYVNIEELKNILSKTDPSDADEDVLARYATIASRVIDRRTDRHFYPLKATRSFDIPKDQRGNQRRQLNLDFDLLSVTSLTNGDGTDLAGEFLTLPGVGYPKYAVKLKPSSNHIWETDTNGEWEQVIDLDGIWGWHDDWDNAWENVDSLDTAMNTTVTTVSVNDVDGDDAHGFSPRLGRQMLIRINSEYMYVFNSDATENDLTVERAVNGSTVEAHSSGDDVFVYRPPWDINQLARRLTLWLWRQRNSSIDVDRPAITTDGVTVMPIALPQDVEAMLEGLRRTGV